MLVKYSLAWDECWGKGIKSSPGSNVMDGIGVANPFQMFYYVVSRKDISRPPKAWFLSAI